MGFTVWFTGLSGSGKSTLSQLLYREMKRRGRRVELLDGDIIRSNFSQELGFSKRDRDINVKRIGFVAHLLNRNGVDCVVAAIAPYAEARATNRKLLDKYVEVFCDSPLEVVVQRDVKGLYKKALAGEILHFTGVSDPYETPQEPEIHVHTDAESVEQSYARVLGVVEQLGLLLPGFLREREPCSEVEDRLRRERLVALGYARKC